MMMMEIEHNWKNLQNGQAIYRVSIAFFETIMLK